MALVTRYGALDGARGPGAHDDTLVSRRWRGPLAAAAARARSTGHGAFGSR